jgi:hypothetical protein
VSKIKSDKDVAALEKYILDINAEGELLREIDDIKDELGMMIYFKERQQHVLDEFEVEVGHILDQSLEPPGQQKVVIQRAESKDLPHLQVISDELNSKDEVDTWIITPEKANWTKARITDRQRSLKGQHAEIMTLFKNAEQAEQAVRFTTLMAISSEKLIP